MPVRFLSVAELARLSSWPDEIAADDLVTFFTLTSDDLGGLGSNVRVENRLGAAVQLCAGGPPLRCGTGPITAFSSRQRPSHVTGSPVQSARHSRMDSSTRPTRFSKGAPTAANSAWLPG